MPASPTNLLLAALLACLLLGCDGRPRRVPVAGRVTIDGQPLTSGFIQLIPAQARPAMSEINADGSFELSTYGEGDGCVLGQHTVTVFSVHSQSPTTKRWLTPPKYHDPATSGLRVDISGPQSNLEIALTWAGEKPFIEETHATQGDLDPAKL